MNTREEDAFLRWQAVRLEQLSFVNNLVIGLATGLFTLACSASVVGIKELTGKGRCLVLLTLWELFASISVGLICAWNRLLDFRAVAALNRLKVEDNNPDLQQALRDKSQTLSARTWVYLAVQTAFFWIGAFATLILAITRV